ncbi:hypothetical protein ACJX0J_040926, partial [Zea mays]
MAGVCFLVFPRLMMMPIAFLSTLLEADDRAVRMAAGEALALCFELNLLDVSSREDDGVNTGGTTGSKNKLFLDMQALKTKISEPEKIIMLKYAGIGRTRNCFMFYGLNLYYINYQMIVVLYQINWKSIVILCDTRLLIYAAVEDNHEGFPWNYLVLTTLDYFYTCNKQHVALHSTDHSCAAPTNGARASPPDNGPLVLPNYLFVGDMRHLSLQKVQIGNVLTLGLNNFNVCAYAQIYNFRQPCNILAHVMLLDIYVAPAHLIMFIAVWTTNMRIEDSPTCTRDSLASIVMVHHNKNMYNNNVTTFGDKITLRLTSFNCEKII